MLSVTWNAPNAPRGNVSYTVAVNRMDLATDESFTQESYNVTMEIFDMARSDQFYVLYVVTVTAFTTAGSSTPVNDSCTTEEGRECKAEERVVVSTSTSVPATITVVIN